MKRARDLQVSIRGQVARARARVTWPIGLPEGRHTTCPGEATQSHAAFDETHEEVIREWPRRRVRRRRAPRRRLRRRRSRQVCWTWHVLGGLVGETRRPILDFWAPQR